MLSGGGRRGRVFFGGFLIAFATAGRRGRVFTGGVLTRIETIADSDGGSDEIVSGDGSDVVVGGAAGDIILAGGGDLVRDVVLGDGGFAEFTDLGVLTTISKIRSRFFRFLKKAG